MENNIESYDNQIYQPEPEPEPEVESFKNHQKNIKNDYETDSESYYDSDISELQPINDDIFNIDLIEVVICFMFSLSNASIRIFSSLTRNGLYLIFFPVDGSSNS